MMSEVRNYITVVAVKCEPFFVNQMCEVPAGAFVENGSAVLFGESKKQGTCISNMVYLDRETLDMVCAVTGAELPLEKIVAKCTYEWYGECDAEQ